MARLAHQQHHLQHALHLLDLPAQRRLRDKEPLGGQAEAAGIDDFNEVA